MFSDHLLKELNQFKDREIGLRKVTRYSLYKAMWYRTDLWTHTRRISWIVEELIPIAQKVFGKDFNPEKAVALALVHDDAEMIFGDIQAGNKAKMSKEELDKLDQLELDSARILSEKYPKMLGNFVYHDLMIEAVNRSSVESILVSWADKYDAFCEALHELYAGNITWTINVENEYGKIDLATEYYMKYFNSFEEKFPLSKGLFSIKNNWFVIPVEPDIMKIVKGGKKHTLGSLRIKKGYQQYDQWIALTLSRGSDEDIYNLYINKE